MVAPTLDSPVELVTAGAVIGVKLTVISSSTGVPKVSEVKVTL